MKSLAQKIEEINNGINGALSLTCYNGKWRAHSHGAKPLFGCPAKGGIWANSFTKLIEKVYSMKKFEESNGAK